MKITLRAMEENKETKLSDLPILVNRVRSYLNSYPSKDNKKSEASLAFHQCTQSKVEMPDINKLYVFLVLEGSLRLYTPSGILDYEAGQYSISKIDTPTSGYVLTFSDKEDFLALSLDFQASEVIPIVLELEGSLTEKILNEELESEVVSWSDAQFINHVNRLVSLLDKPTQLALFEKQIKREITLCLLSGSSGSQFLKSVINFGEADKIYDANSWIKENFRTSFSVDSLAERWNMSVSQFHQKFKSAVGMGLLQCQKRLRLTEARRLMLDENLNVTQAAFEVGYDSVSRFTRKYSKMFGQPPKENILALRRNRKN